MAFKSVLLVRPSALNLFFRSLAEAWEAQTGFQHGTGRAERLLLQNREEHSQAPLDFARNVEALAQGSRQTVLAKLDLPSHPGFSAPNQDLRGASQFGRMQRWQLGVWSRLSWRTLPALRTPRCDCLAAWRLECCKT